MSISTYTTSILNKYWNTTTIPVDPLRIAISMGLIVVANPNLEHLGIYTSEIPRIAFDSSKSILQRRFAIAHMIGHHVLNHGDVPVETSSNFTVPCDSPMENEANLFAANLLVPTDALKACIDVKGINSTEKLAVAFQVSRAIITMRLDEIGYTRSTAK